MEPLPWYQIAAPVVACLVTAALAAAGYTRFRFALLGAIAAVGYGMLQDQVSARLAPEYFTLFHRPIAGLIDPTLLGITWGFLGTWWAGLFLGYMAGLIATLGQRPKLSPGEVVGPVFLLIAGVAATVAIAGASVWRYAVQLDVRLDPALRGMVPPERHQALLVVACYHFVGYAAAFASSVVLFIWIWRERVQRSASDASKTQPERFSPSLHV